jgi:hypothetical protein
MAKTRSRNSALSAVADQRLEQIDEELERWRERAVPDPLAPLDADDVARLVRDCLHSFDVDAASGDNFSVNTVHYYRRKDILDEPDGRTSAARYTIRHVWQAVGARLAGYLGLVTLAEAREQIRGADEPVLRRFVAARVADARARQATRLAASTTAARPLPQPAPIAASAMIASAALTATIIPLGGNAMCLLPFEHAALRSPAAARALIDALAGALGVEPSR